MPRAVAPVVGVCVLVVLTLVTAAVAGAGVLALEAPTPSEGLTLSVTADGDTDRIVLTHRGGPALDVRDLTVSIHIGDQALDHQPPVPYFAAEGFVGAPSGPFNQAADPEWSTGERASIGIASTNSPRPDSGERVTVSIASEGRVLVRASTVAA